MPLFGPFLVPQSVTGPADAGLCSKGHVQITKKERSIDRVRQYTPCTPHVQDQVCEAYGLFPVCANAWLCLCDRASERVYHKKMHYSPPAFASFSPQDEYIDKICRWYKTKKKFNPKLVACNITNSTCTYIWGVPRGIDPTKKFGIRDSLESARECIIFLSHNEIFVFVKTFCF